MISALRRIVAVPRAGVLLLAGSTYGALVLGFVTGPLLARALGPTGRGEVASVQIYATFATMVLGVGTWTAVLHAVREKENSEAQILGAVLRYSLWLVPAGLCVAGAVTQFVLVNLHGAARLWCFVTLAAVPLSVLAASLLSFFLARAALSWIAFLRLTSTGAVAVVVVILAITGALTVVAYLALSFAVSILALLLSVAALRVRPRRGGRLLPLLRFGRRAWLGSMANLANVGLDQVLIAPFLGAEALGHYTIAVTLALIPLGLSTAIGSRIWGDADIGANETVDVNRVGGYVRTSMASAAWMAFGLAVTMPVALPLLYGSAFDASIVPLLLLLPGTVAYSGASILESALVMSGRPEVNSRAELAALACTVLGLAVLLPTIGIVGAAMVTSVAYAVRLAVQVRVLRRMGRLDWRPRSADMRHVGAEVVGLVRSTLVRARGAVRARAS